MCVYCVCMDIFQIKTIWNEGEGRQPGASISTRRFRWPFLLLFLLLRLYFSSSFHYHRMQLNSISFSLFLSLFNAHSSFVVWNANASSFLTIIKVSSTPHSEYSYILRFYGLVNTNTHTHARIIQQWLQLVQDIVHSMCIYIHIHLTVAVAMAWSLGT